MGQLPIDPALVARARGGDDRALDELLTQLEPMLYRFGVTLCHHPEDARGVRQETMITLVESLDQFRGEASLSSWLYAIARSHCSRRRRKSKFAPAHMESLDDNVGGVFDVASDEPRPDELIDQRRLAAIFERAVADLEPGQRQVLLLRDLEGMSAKDVARALDLSVAAVKSRLHRARAAVQARADELLRAQPIEKTTTSATD